jgi:hypothetical protein
MEMKDDQFFSVLQVMEHRWNEIDRGKPNYSGKKPVPVPHRVTRDRTRASARHVFIFFFPKILRINGDQQLFGFYK